MKKITLLFMMATTTMFSQNYNKRWSEKDPADYVYFNGSFDVNMAFGLKDNADTAEFDDRGFDFDVEIGARDNHFGVFMFYGKFKEINYQNYGAGVDYYINKFRDAKILNGVDLSIGVAYGVVIRQDYDNDPEKTKHGYNGNQLRVISTLWITNDIGLTLRFQLTEAGDLPNKTFRKEGSAGITIKFNRN